MYKLNLWITKSIIPERDLNLITMLKIISEPRTLEEWEHFILYCNETEN